MRKNLYILKFIMYWLGMVSAATASCRLKLLNTCNIRSLDLGLFERLNKVIEDLGSFCLSSPPFLAFAF